MSRNRPEQPDKETMCHRTGFTKTCFECVTAHGCRLWKRVTLEGHPENGKPVDHYDCADSLIDLYLKDMLRRQVQTTATVDGLRKEVQQANDVGVASTSAATGIVNPIRTGNGCRAKRSGRAKDQFAYAHGKELPPGN